MPPANSGKPEPLRSLPDGAGASVPARSNGPERRGMPAPGNAWRSGPPGLPPALASGPDLAGLLKALRRRWFLALSLGLVGATAAAAGIYCLLSPRYTAFAQVHIDYVRPFVINPEKDNGGREFSTYQNTQAAKIRSRFVLNAALKRDDVRALPIVQAQPEPLLWLEEELKVEFKEGAEFLTVLMTGPDPDAAVAIVGAVVQAYLHEVNQEEPRRKSQRLTELEDILTKANLKLKQKKELFCQRAEDLGTPDAPAIVQKQVNLLSTLGEYRSQNARLRGDLMRAEGKLKSHQAQQKQFLDPTVPDGAYAEAVQADAYCQTHLQRLSRVQDVMDDYRRHSRNPESEPTYREAKEKDASIRKTLDARIAQIREEVAKRFRAKARADYETVLNQLQTEVTLVAEHEHNARAQVEALTKEAEKIGHSSTEMELLRADIRREERTAEQVGDEAQKLAVEVRAPARAILAQEAGLQRKDIKRLLMGLAAGPLTVFAAICLCVAWFEFRARRIRSADEVVAGLGMRVVGSVPALGAARRPAGDGTEQDAEDHELLESIDGIRTILLRNASVEETRVIMVTSAVSGEGKTTLASHLATSLARAGRKTLLVDCDLRRPAAHQLFELPLQPGLSETLLNEVHVAEATRSTTVDGLWVIPAGQWDREVMHALARDGMAEIFEKLKGEYDFIVVDSHPVLPANDALLVGQHVDAVLLSLLRDVSQAPRVYAACQRLQALGIRILGAVVNGMPQDDYSGGYQYTQQPARAA